MEGFTVRFETKKEFLETYNFLRKEKFINEFIILGTDVINDYSSDSIEFNEEYKTIQYIDEKKLSDKKYVTLSIKGNEEEEEFITGLSVGLPCEYMLENEPDTIGKNGITIGFNTVYDDEKGDVYQYLVEPKDILTYINQIEE